MTLIVLLILAGVSLSAVFSEKGIFSRAEKAGNKYNEAKAREVLETVLLADGQYEKNSNPKYNQDNFLDALIKSEIEGADVKGDVAIIGGYAFELDRSVPKIGRYLGLAKDLIWPTVRVSNPKLAEDYRTASFTVTAIEETNGINKIEIWLNGEKIKDLDKTYSNVKTEIEETFTVNKNGIYTVKVYGKLMASKTVEVTGIVPAVEFTPNGNTDWKKEHQTKITVKTNETITSMKYLWTTSGTNPPEISDFNNAEACTNNSIITGGNDIMTGTYYLWVLLTVGTGENQKTNICGSEGFNFDNEGPTVTLESTPVSETSFILTATASDNHSGIAKYEFYIDGEKKDPDTVTEEGATYTWNGTEMAEKNCYVIVTDKAGNPQRADKEASTKMYAWEKWNAIEQKHYKVVIGPQDPGTYYFECGNSAIFYNSYTINHTNGTFNLGGDKISNPTEERPGYSVSTDGKTLTQYSGQPYSSSAKLNNIKRDFEITKKHNYKIKESNAVMLAVCIDDFTAYTRKITLEEDGIEYIKGNTLQGTVKNINQNKYPNDGEKDGFWYVSLGIQ